MDVQMTTCNGLVTIARLIRGSELRLSDAGEILSPRKEYLDRSWGITVLIRYGIDSCMPWTRRTHVGGTLVVVSGALEAEGDELTTEASS